MCRKIFCVMEENRLSRGFPHPGANVDTTVWGRVSTLQSLVNAFDNDPDARRYQDVGLDGLTDEDEQVFFANYLNQLKIVIWFMMKFMQKF
jgi:cell surface protein SprA